MYMYMHACFYVGMKRNYHSCIFDTLTFNKCTNTNSMISN